MQKNNCLTALSFAALLVAAPAAFAEMPNRGEHDRGEQGGAGADHGGAGAVMTQHDATGAGQRSDAPNGRQGDRSDAQKMDRQGDNAGARGGSTERAGNRDNKGYDAGKQAKDGDRDKSGRDQAERNRDERQSKDQHQDKAATGGTPKTGEAGKGGDASRESRDTAKGENARKAEEVRQKVTSGERDRARDAFSKASDLKRAKDVNVRVNVGVGLPRGVELYPLPAGIIGIVPVYRDYRYVVVDDDICIVDPETYVIVDVIHRGEGRHAEGHGARFELTDQEQRYIRDHIDRGRRADIHISIGTDVPNSVELYAFPEPVLNEVPKVRDYRYVVGDDGVAIVDPKSKGVVYVIQKG